jgi:ABC-type multidrug transport system fused ATPase/permease subunit
MARNGNNKVTLDTARVFTSLSLFTLLSDPLQSLIMTLVTFMGSVGSFHRIQEFLCTQTRLDSRRGPPDTELIFQSDGEFIKKKLSTSNDSGDIEGDKSLAATPREEYRHLSEFDAVVVVDSNFGRDKTKEPLLQSINLTIPRGKFFMIVGPVGCGKSTLLKGLLGEVPLLGGSVLVSSLEVAFCDQTPWHMNGTIQESIIGAGILEQTWYSTVVRACVLLEDFRQLPRGDQTLIGSKGIALSGGQSQRIVSHLLTFPDICCFTDDTKALARAVYARKDIIFLDDVLSGLDIDTENQVFHNLFGANGLLRKYNSTVLMASSSGKRVPYADHVIVLDSDGKITEQGSFRELNAQGGYVSSFSLSPPDWNYEKTNTGIAPHSTKESAVISLDRSPQDESSRLTGDVAVYLYYIQAVGWIPTLIFIVAISAFVFCLSFPSMYCHPDRIINH